MSRQIGRNDGITGLIDLPGSGTPTFAVRIYRFREAISASETDRAGRGDGDWPTLGYNGTTGNLVVSGKVRLDGAPFPGAFKGKTGTVTIQHHTGVTQAVPVFVSSAELKNDSAADDGFDITLVCRITGDITLTGFGGTAPTSTTPADGDKELWAGMSKTKDPTFSLQDGAIQRFDVFGVADTDAAEVTKLTDAIAAATTPPISGLKLRVLNLQRLSSRRIILTYQWARTTTADDVINSATSKRNDTQKVATSETTAAINSAAPAATLPNMTLVTTSTRKLDDGNVLNVNEYGLRNTRQGIEQDGTSLTIDPNDLSSQEQVTETHDTSNPPADPTPETGLKIAAQTTRQVNNLTWATTWQMAKNDSRDEVIFGAQATVTDPNGLQSRATVADIDATPATPSGLVARTTTTRNLTPDHVVNVLEAGTRDTKDDIEMPGTYTNIDPQDLEGDGLHTRVYNTADGYGTPPTPDPGLQISGFKTQKIDRVKSVAIWTFERDTSTQKVINRAEGTTTDPNGLNDRRFIARIYTTLSGAGADPALPTGMKLYTYDDKPLSSLKSLRIYEYRRYSTKDELELSKKYTDIDPDGVDSEGVEAILYATAGGPPADPTPPAGLKIARRRDQVVNPLQTVRIYKYEENTPLEAIERQATVSVADAVDAAVHQIGDVMSSTSTAQALAESYLNTYKNDPLFNSVKVRKITEDRNQVVLSVSSGLNILTYKVLDSGSVLRPTRLSGSNAQVFIHQVINQGTNRRAFEVLPTFQRATRMLFSITRRLAGTGTYPTYFTKLNKVNDDTFLGLEAGTVAYLGAEGKDNRAISGNHVQEVTWNFLYDSNGHIDESQIAMGWVHADTTSAPAGGGTWPTARGWTNVGNLGWTAAVVPSVSFTDFLA